MLRIKSVGIALIALLTILYCPFAFGCTVCHSKNPKMVRMHEKLGYKDCFKCHRPGSKTNGDELRIQMASDPNCIQCHGRK